MAENTQTRFGSRRTERKTSIFDFLPALGGGLEGLFAGLDLSGRNKRRKEIIESLRAESNVPAIGEEQISGLIPNIRGALAPRINRVAGDVSRRVGLDSPAAQGEIARSLVGGEQEALLGLKIKAIMANAQKRHEFLKLIAQIQAE